MYYVHIVCVCVCVCVCSVQFCTGVCFLHVILGITQFLFRFFQKFGVVTQVTMTTRAVKRPRCHGSGTAVVSYTVKLDIIHLCVCVCVCMYVIMSNYPRGC